MDQHPSHIERRPLLAWAKRYGRSFPWREGSPYEVAVAEVLLQKTRGEAIEPVWRALLARYPDAGALAGASVVDVSRIVAPLGLKRQRAGRLIAMAQTLNEPALDEPAARGLGPYGLAVVRLTQSRRPRRIPVDGNIARVVTRFMGYSWDRGEPRKKPEVRAVVSNALDTRPHRALRVLYALVDLGATVCTPRAPACHRCPLSRSCVTSKGKEPSNSREAAVRP